MRTRNAAALILLGGVAALAVAVPVLGQESPQSILPPGFGSSAQPSAPSQPAAPSSPAAGAPAANGDDVPVLALTPPAGNDAAAADDGSDDDNSAEAEALAAAEALRKQNIPDFARAPTDHVGFLSSGVTGIPMDGFGASNGRFLATLMARLDAPVASRWVSMLLRRVLTTDIATPVAVDPADWVAERALLLTRMGEADSARLLVQKVDPDKATPRLYDAIMAAAMASADPAALCQVADQAEGVGSSPDWPLARAMCSGLSNEGGTASALVDRARSLPGAPQGIDLQLAERIVAAGTDGRRATSIEWSGVYDLDSWRFGLASAAGLAIPDNLLDAGGLALQGWRARAPMLPLATRIGAQRTAATLGVISSVDLVDAYSANAEAGDPFAADQSPAGRLRAAYAARDVSDRMTALRALWADPNGERDLYAAHILTARAAARIGPSADYSGDAAALIEAMLSAGLDTQAEQWAAVARAATGTAGEEAWAQLAVGAPGRVVDIDASRVSGFGEGGRGSARLRAQFLFAGLAALGRLAPGDVRTLSGELEVPLGVRDVWTQAIDRAAAQGEPATVALLAAVGMQTSDWTQVSPVFLYHIVSDLRAVGFEPEARMIAAESLART